MALRSLFPTLVYEAALQRSGNTAINRQLLKECQQLREDDAAGRRWSGKNYPGGYTSYGSVHRLQEISPTFQLLQRKLKRHVAIFTQAAQWDLKGRELEMTDCWINIMPRQVVHACPKVLPASSSKTHAWIASWRRRRAAAMRRLMPSRGSPFPPLRDEWFYSKAGCAMRSCRIPSMLNESA
jgi:hypothetical protein